MRVSSPKSQVANGLRTAGLWLIGFLWLGLVFGGMAVAFTLSPHSPALGWGLLAVAAIVLIATMDKWVKVFLGLLAYGVFSSILILLDGHGINHPDVRVSRLAAVVILMFFVAAAALSFSFTKHRLTIPDRIALFMFVLCFFGQAAFRISCLRRWLWDLRSFSGRGRMTAGRLTIDKAFTQVIQSGGISHAMACFRQLSWNLAAIRRKVLTVRTRYFVITTAVILICNPVWAQNSTLPPSTTDSVKEAVNAFYDLITKYKPIGIPKEEAKQSLWPLLSSRLARQLDELQACENDYFSRYEGILVKEQLKPEIGWLESGLFSGGAEAASPSRFVITKVLPKPKGSFEVHLRFTYKNTEEEWDYEGIVFVVWENGRYVIDDFAPLYPYRALSQGYKGCRRGKWVGRAVIAAKRPLASLKINRVRIPTSSAESLIQKTVLPHDIGISGDIVLDVLVQKDGRVLNARGVSGDPRLVRVAKPAIMKWQFIPYFLNGEPVQFLTKVTIQFDGKNPLAKLKIEGDPLATRSPKQDSER